LLIKLNRSEQTGIRAHAYLYQVFKKRESCLLQPCILPVLTPLPNATTVPHLGLHTLTFLGP